MDSGSHFAWKYDKTTNVINQYLRFFSVSSPRLYIATRDIRDSGGVKSMASFVYRTAENAGYDPCLVCNVLDRETQVRMTSPIRAIKFDPAANVEHMTVDGMEMKGVPLVIPEIEFTQYYLNAAGWRSAIEDGDLFFAVGGTNQCNTPLVHTGEQFGSWTATLLWDDRVDRLRSAPLIERVRDRLSRAILELLERRAFETADPALALSEHTADRISERYGITNVEVVPYPIDIDRFSPETADDALETDGPVVLFVGRYNDPRKNTTMLIEAFASVREAIPSAQLWLVGADPSTRIREAVAVHGISDAVTFHERVPNVELPKYYNAADTFVISSNQEGLAIVGLESMACGTPVVATRCGGPEQYVRDGETGYVVPKDEPSLLADRLTKLLSDQDLAERLGHNARDLIVETYAKTKIQNRFEEVFQRLLDR